MKKIAYIIFYLAGIIASLIAARSLIYLVSIMSTLGAPRSLYASYVWLFWLSLGSIVFFIRAWLGKLSEVWKWTCVTLMVGGAAVMMKSPAIPSMILITSMLFVASGCLIFAEVREGGRKFPKWGKIILVLAYGVLLFIFLAAVLLGNKDRDNRSSRGSNPITTRREGVAAPAGTNTEALNNPSDNFLKLCRDGTPQEVENAIKTGVNVNKRYLFDNTALILAAYNNNLEVVITLIKNGADVNAQNQIGWTALMYAACFGDPEVVITLIDNGADVSLRDVNGRAAVYHAKDNEKVKNSEAMVRLFW